MIFDYKGNFSYDKLFVQLTAPDQAGVYYMGDLNNNKSLRPMYIGRALGEGVTVKSRLLDHLNKNQWPDVTHFGYKICTTVNEVETLEKQEIIRLNPKYNKRIG